MKRMILLAAAFVLLVFAAAAVHRWWFTPVWPEFAAAAAGSQPQVKYEVGTKRDYAFRVGDLVRIDMFVHQAAGTLVQVAQPAVGGDYELSRLPEVSERANEDGSVTYRVRLSVQSFEVKPKLTLAISMGFQKSPDAGVEEFKAQPLELYWSNTWDGRADLKEGDDLHPSPLAYWLRYAVPFAAGLTLYLALVVWGLIRWLRRLLRAKAEDALRVQFRTVLAKVKSGEARAQDHAELDSLVRQCWPVGPVPLLEMEGSLSPVCKFLVLNAQGTYGEAGRLDDEARQTLGRLGDKLLEIWGGTLDWQRRLSEPVLTFAEPAYAICPERIPLMPQDVPTAEQMAPYASPEAAGSQESPAPVPNDTSRD